MRNASAFFRYRDTFLFRTLHIYRCKTVWVFTVFSAKHESVCFLAPFRPFLLRIYTDKSPPLEPPEHSAAVQRLLDSLTHVPVPVTGVIRH